MFSNVRWRIALWFIGLSTAVYIVPTVLAMVLFYSNLTAAIDAELKVFLASFGHAITLVDGKPVLRDWARIVQTVPAHSLVAYQLFDKDGQLVEEHGEPGIPVLFLKQREVSSHALSMRTCCTSLKDNDKKIGYLQVQLPTNPRDNAVRELALVTAIFAPIVLLGLGFSSYLVSEKATASIQQTNAMLRRFIADASHELYTPLSIVQAANESLERVFESTGLGLSEFEITESALGRMESMLEDLTLLSSMDNPALSVSNENISLEGLLEDVVNEFRPKFDQKGIGLLLAIEGQGQIFGDSVALHRMLANIVENALRYTDANGRVDITLTKEAHVLKTTVSDTGIGIPKDSMANIFDRFYRVDPSRSRHSGGSGLGLPIAQAIAVAHGGSIDAHSKLGSGSTFCITLPLIANS